MWSRFPSIVRMPPTQQSTPPPDTALNSVGSAVAIPRFAAALTMAEPIGCSELRSAEAWLRRLGALEAFRKLAPRWRLEREARLPRPRESFQAVRTR